MIATRYPTNTARSFSFHLFPPFPLPIIEFAGRLRSYRGRGPGNPTPLESGRRTREGGAEYDVKIEPVQDRFLNFKRLRSTRTVTYETTKLAFPLSA